MADKGKYDKVRSRSRDAFAEMDREIAKMNKSGELRVTNSKDKPPAKNPTKAKAPPKAAPPKQQQKAAPPKQQQPAAPPKQQQPESGIASKPSVAPPKQQPVTPPKQQPKRKGGSEDAFSEMEGMIKAGREKYGPGYRGETQTMETGRDGKKRVSHTVRTAKDKEKKKK